MGRPDAARNCYSSKKKKQKWYLEPSSETSRADPFRYGKSRQTQSLEYAEGIKGIKTF